MISSKSALHPVLVLAGASWIECYFPDKQRLYSVIGFLWVNSGLGKAAGIKEKL